MPGSVNGENDEQAPADNEIAERAVLDANSTTDKEASVIDMGSPETRAPRPTAADRTHELLEAGHHYHRLGFNVITVGGNKRPNTGTWEKHQRIRQTGETMGTLPFDTAYGLGGVCGEISSAAACLDFDKVEGDRIEFANRVLDALGLPRSYAWLVFTPTGVHIWLRLLGSLDGRGKLIGHIPGCHHVELRFDGHYAILPPTRRQDGGVYSFPNVTGLPDAPPAEVPVATVLTIAAWDESRPASGKTAGSGMALVSRTVTSKYVETAVQRELESVRSAEPGTRNNVLVKAAFSIGTMMHLGLSEDRIVERLLEAATECGLSMDEALSTVRSGLLAGMEKPRDQLLYDGGQHQHEEARRPFPLNVLPELVRKYVVEAAVCVGCPPDMIAVPLLAYAAATIGRTRAIQIKPHYVKHPVFWFGIVGEPGSGKSPADGLARSFAEALQAKAYAEWQEAYQGWRLEHELWKQRVKGKGGGKVSMGCDSYEVDPEPEEPVLEHYFTTDATIEALAPILLSSAGVAVAHDELVGWVKSMGAYNGAAGRDRAQMLSLWAERSLKVDRKGRPPLYVEDPVAVIIGGVQPDVLADLAGEADKRDGFVDRFLWSWPEHRPVPWTENTVSPFTAAAVETIFRRLRGTTDDIAPIKLSDEAKALWREWYDDNARAMETERGLMAGVRAKADVHLARLALVLHVLEHDEPDAAAVQIETLRAATELVEYHLAHARVVAKRLGVAANTSRTGHGSTLRQRVIARLQEHGGWMSASDLAKGLGGHVLAPERDAELDRLETDGLIQSRIKASGELGGRPAVQWRYHVITCELNNPECAA